MQHPQFTASANGKIRKTDACRKVLGPSQENANKKGCWEWQGYINTNGYGSMSYQAKKKDTHLISWFLKTGSFSKLWILHSCDNRKCVNPKHLREGTPTDNNRDRDMRGRSCVGESHWQAKLTETKVKEIRKRLKKGESVLSLEREYNVSRGSIAAIKNKTAWKHVK